MILSSLVNGFCVMGIKSVTELAKYSIGDTLYYIYVSDPFNDLDSDYPQWMNFEHPNVLYSTNAYSSMWPYLQNYPKIAANGFESIIKLLSCELDICPFVIDKITRNTNTGQFNYFSKGEVMPESILFESEISARKEINRINSLFKLWLTRHGGKNV